MKYWYTTKIWIQRHLMYRTRVAIWAFTSTINFAIFPFIWLFIYGDRQMIEGLSRADIVSYYLLMALIGLGFSSHIALIIRVDIVEGRLNTFLVKPINYLLFQFTRELAYRLLMLPIIAVLFSILLVLFPNYVLLPVSWLNFVLFLLSLILSLFISSCIQCLIGISAFWLGENTALNNLKHVIEKVFSGQLAPLIFFPSLLQVIAIYLPFKYMFYFPFQIYTGKLSLQEILINFSIALAWFIFLLWIVAITWKKGVKKYDGAGI